MVTVEPMLLSEVYLSGGEVFEQYKGWSWGVKENGVRALVHVKDGKIVGLRGRSGGPLTYMFPELRGTKINCDTAILDCEICVFDGNGRSVYYKGVDQRRSDPTEDRLKRFPATLVIFDIIYLDGKSLLTEPYWKRYGKILNISASDNIKVAKGYKDGRELWNKVVNENLEGVVIKNPDAIYDSGKRSKEYVKLKNYKPADVKVESSESNPKGSKIFGKSIVDGQEIDVEVQIHGVQDIQPGEVYKIKYLDIVGNKFILPTINNGTC